MVSVIAWSISKRSNFDARQIRKYARDNDREYRKNAHWALSD
jgi:hypothetical protein